MVQTETWQSGVRDSVTGRPNKNHEPDKMEPQNFVRSRSEYKPHNLEFQNFTCGRQPPQTLQNEVPKFHPRQAQSKLEKQGRGENSS